MFQSLLFKLLPPHVPELQVTLLFVRLPSAFTVYSSSSYALYAGFFSAVPPSTLIELGIALLAS